MISVIIPESKDRMHFIRCLNSVTGKSYAEMEFLLINCCFHVEIGNRYSIRTIENKDSDDFCKGLNKAVAAATGEYIFIMDVSAVVSPGFIDSLISKGKDVFAFGQEYILSVKGAKEKATSMLSCFGKLFRKDIIYENNLHFEGNNYFSEYLFTAEYMSFLNDVAATDGCIYGSADMLSRNMIIDCEKWSRVFKRIKNAAEDVKIKISEALCRIIKESDICSEELMYLAEQEFHSNYGLNYECSAPVLRVLWEKVKSTKDSDAFSKLMDYLEKYEDEPILPLIMKKLNLAPESFNFFKTDNINNALFLCLKALEPDGKADAKENRVDAIGNMDIRTAVYEKTLLYFRNGQLGFRTLYKFFCAWLKYKIKKWLRTEKVE